MNTTSEIHVVVGERRQPSVSMALFNPFHYLAGGSALGLGLLVIVLAGLIGSLSKTHFDGVLDFHTGRAGPVWLFVVEGIVDWFSMGMVLYVLGLFFSRSRKLRAVDVFGTQALARWPGFLTVLLTQVPGFQRAIAALVTPQGTVVPPTRLTPDLVVMIAVVVASLVLLVWMVALMYRGYAVACNVKGARGVVSFIVGLLLAEVISKVAIYGLFLVTQSKAAG